MTSMVEMKLNKILSFSSFSYTVLAELGFKQEVKRIRANVSYQRFTRFILFLPHLLRFMTF